MSHDLVAAALAVSTAQQERRWLKTQRARTPICCRLKDGTQVEGRLAYVGVMAFGLHLPDGSSRAIRYSDLVHSYARTGQGTGGRLRTTGS